MTQQTGLSRSSVHRLTQAMARRGGPLESWLWETADGRQELTRLVIATLSTFGLKRGVGMDTMSEFLARLRIERQVGGRPRPYATPCTPWMPHCWRGRGPRSRTRVRGMRAARSWAL